MQTGCMGVRNIKSCLRTQNAWGISRFISIIIENHDEPRGVSHYIPEADVSDTSKKNACRCQRYAPRLPFIYQGQELGMTNVAFLHK